MRTVKINSLSNFQIHNTVLLTILTTLYINHITRIYLFYNWKFVPFDHLHPFRPLPTLHLKQLPHFPRPQIFLTTPCDRKGARCWSVMELGNVGTNLETLFSGHRSHLFLTNPWKPCIPIPYFLEASNWGAMGGCEAFWIIVRRKHFGKV